MAAPISYAFIKLHRLRRRHYWRRSRKLPRVPAPFACSPGQGGRSKPPPAPAHVRALSGKREKQRVLLMERGMNLSAHNCAYGFHSERHLHEGIIKVPTWKCISGIITFFQVTSPPTCYSSEVKVKYWQNRDMRGTLDNYRLKNTKPPSHSQLFVLKL